VSSEYPPEVISLRDGMPVTIRPIHPDDAPRLQALVARLSPESIFFRFMQQLKSLPLEEARRLATVDYHTSIAFVATCAEAGAEHIIGVIRYIAIGAARPGVAEAALVVEDGYQRQGLGVLLTDRILAHARAHGIHTFVAEVSLDNSRMMKFIERTGLPATRKLESGVWEIQVKLDK
jgi:RimJ/RimL family protein N-acetyltransferase